MLSDASVGEDARLVREVLFSSRANVNFIHELFRQALCLSFRYSEAIKTVIMCYRDWIQMVSGGRCLSYIMCCNS